MNYTDIIINTVAFLGLTGGLVALAREIERAYINYTWKRRFKELRKELDAEVEITLPKIKKLAKKAVKKSK